MLSSCFANSLLGEGIAALFMRPYNFKVWAVPTTKVNIEPFFLTSIVFAELTKSTCEDAM